MVKIRTEKYDPNKCTHNTLYRIDKSSTVQFTEEHEYHVETVYLNFQLEHGQYGIYANEFRNQMIEKRGCKTADVLVFVVDEQQKHIFSFLFDVKSNISAFSDNLLEENNAMITALKEVRDFLEQIEDSMKSKNSVTALYGDYSENENIGIVTKNFDSGKFEAVAQTYDKLYLEENISNPLILHKLRNNLKPYGNIIEKMRSFAQRKVLIGNKTYPLYAYILKKESTENISACQKHADMNISKDIYSTGINLSIEGAVSPSLLPCL
ncbi:MAG: hypothetical protein HDR27_10050 [Lachnospiraceae bacterium]|nr:hypothetical protein [Lachnospiraceae bacterium]